MNDGTGLQIPWRKLIIRTENQMTYFGYPWYPHVCLKLPFEASISLDTISYWDWREKNNIMLWFLAPCRTIRRMHKVFSMMNYFTIYKSWIIWLNFYYGGIKCSAYLMPVELLSEKLTSSCPTVRKKWYLKSKYRLRRKVWKSHERKESFLFPYSAVS